MSDPHPGSTARRGRPKGFGATDPRIAPYVDALLQPEDEDLAEIRARFRATFLPLEDGFALGVKVR